MSRDCRYKKQIARFTFAAMILLFVRCTPPVLQSETELLKYLHDKGNGYLKSQTIKKTRIAVTYHPTDFWASREMKDQATDEALQRSRARYQSQVYFLVGFSMNERPWVKEVAALKGGYAWYSKMVQTLSFNMEPFVYLTSGKDTVHMTDYRYQQLYGMGLSDDLLLAFPRNELSLQKDDLLILHIDEFGGGLGRLTFAFDAAKILNEPKIQFVND